MNVYEISEKPNKYRLIILYAKTVMKVAVHRLSAIREMIALKNRMENQETP